MVGRFRNTFRGYRRSWSCLTHLVRVQSPTHCDQCDQLWRIRGVGIPRKPSVQQKSAHNLGVVLPWFKEQWDRQGGALCVQAAILMGSSGCGRPVLPGDGEGAHRHLAAATLTMATAPCALTESKLRKESSGVRGLLLGVRSALCTWKQIVRIHSIPRPYTRSSCGRLCLPSV